jgi:peptidoglycan/LPS O-acetylase OafA/YrhL
MQRLRGLLAPSLLANHYPSLHGIRALAILLIVQLHLSLYATMAGMNLLGPSWTVSVNAWFGMDLFFVLSGFLIGKILLFSMEKRRKHYVLRFYLRRAFRILPLYYVVFGLLALIVGLSAFQRNNLVHELVYLTNYPFSDKYLMPWSWSLSVEEHFYIAAPVVLIMLRFVPGHTARLTVLALTWASGLAVRWLAYAQHPEPFNVLSFMQVVYAPTHVRYDALVAGIFVAYLDQHFRPALARAFAHPVLRVLGVLVPVLILLVILNPLHTGAHLGLFRDEYLAQVFYVGTLTSIAYGLLILWLLNVDSGFSRVMSTHTLRIFATFGYGIYLVHIPVIQLAVLPALRTLGETPGLPGNALWILGLVMAVALSATLAYALHLAVEKPALYLRDRVAR